jgi:uncharacterized protein YidB (DUF937 family)
MGLIDVLNGMQNGPRGERNPSATPNSGSGGMSPITMAILGLLAYKAMKGLAGSQPSAAPANTRVPPGGKTIDVNMPGSGVPGGGGMPGSSAPGGSGGIGDLLRGGLGGLLAGGAAGSVLTGGLNDLLKQFQQNGHGDAVDSWVGTGPNKTIAPKQLGQALGSDQISALSAQTGMSRDELLDALSHYLPQVVDSLTPQGRLPTDHEAQRML